MTTLKTGLIFRTRWKLGKKLGEGACAQVFEVEDINPGAQKSIKWVMKLAPLPAAGELCVGSPLLSHLSTQSHFPFVVHVCRGNRQEK